MAKAITSKKTKTDTTGSLNKDSKYNFIPLWLFFTTISTLNPPKFILIYVNEAQRTEWVSKICFNLLYLSVALKWTANYRCKCRKIWELCEVNTNCQLYLKFIDCKECHFDCLKCRTLPFFICKARAINWLYRLKTNKPICLLRVQ